MYRIKRNYYDELTGEYLCTLTLRNIHHESIQKFFFNREKNLILEDVRGRLFFNHVHFTIFPATASILNKFSSQSIAAHVSEFEKFISSDNWIPLRIEFSTSEVENTLE